MPLELQRLMRFEPPEYIRSSSRRRRSLLCGMFVFLTLIFLMASVSAWNYFDISFGLPSPSSALSESSSPFAVYLSPPEGRIEWSFDTEEAVDVPPVAHGGLAFIMAGRRIDTGRIIALDMDSGRPVWTYRLNGVSDFPVTLAGNFLYAVTRDGRVIALESQSGREVWSYTTGDLLLGRPVVRDGALFAASNGIHALDALTGEPLWVHRTEGGRTTSPLAYSQGIIAVLSEGIHLNLIDAVKGKRRLTTRLWFGGAGMPMILEDTVVLSGDRGRIQAVNLYARDIPMEKALRFWWTKLWLYKSAPRPPDPVGYLWHHRGLGGLSSHIAATGDGRLFLVARHPDHSATLMGIDANTGDALWRFQSRGPFAEGATLAGATLVAGVRAGTVFGMNAASGKIDWQLALGFRVSGVTVAAEDALLVASEEGAVHKIR